MSQYNKLGQVLSAHFIFEKSTWINRLPLFPPPLFLDQAEASKGRINFVFELPPLSQGLDPALNMTLRLFGRI